MGHIKMMAAAQPFISGAISKTVNLPETATIDDIAEAYTEGWKLGLKALAIYRDGSKTAQALTHRRGRQGLGRGRGGAGRGAGPARRKMPVERESITHKFSIAGHEGYITAGKYEDGSVGEIFLTDIGKEGSTIKGMMNAFATAVSIGLQYGVPLETFVKKFAYVRFEPEGITGNPEIPFAKSMPDYIMRWLARRFIDDRTTTRSSASSPPRSGPARRRSRALFVERGPGPANGGRGRRAGTAPTSRRTARRSGKTVAAKAPTSALTDTPPVRPARMARPRARPGLRAVRRHDAAHRLVLHVLELRQQHRLRLS